MLQISNIKKRTLNVLAITIMIIIIIELFIIILDKINYKCPIHEMFNIYCAGCGTTRMLKELMKGNIVQAFKCNIAMFSLLLLSIMFYIYDSIYYIKLKKLKIIKLKTIYIIVILLFMFMIVRNIKGFEFLQP